MFDNSVNCKLCKSGRPYLFLLLVVSVCASVRVCVCFKNKNGSCMHVLLDELPAKFTVTGQNIMCLMLRNLTYEFDNSCFCKVHQDSTKSSSKSLPFAYVTLISFIISVFCLHC